MDERYFGLALGLMISGIVLFRKGRNSTRAKSLPMMEKPTGEQRRSTQNYFAILALLTLALTGTIVVWGIVSDSS